MTITTSYLTVLSNIKTALVEIEQERIADYPSYPYARINTTDVPYWLNNIGVQSAVSFSGTTNFVFNLNVSAYLVYHYLTSGEQNATTNEHEETAQNAVITSALVLTERHRLQTTSYPKGVAGVMPEGIESINARLSTVNLATGQALAALTSFVIPISVRIERV